MKSKKIITIMLLAVMVVIFSCNIDDFLIPKNNNGADYSKENTNLASEEVGHFHNMVLVKFNEYHPLVASNKLEAGKFADLLLRSINETLSENGIKARVDKKDIALILRYLAKLRDDNIYDAFNPTREGLMRFMDYLARENIIDSSAMSFYKETIIALEENDRRYGSAYALEKLPTVSTGNEKMDSMFSSILMNSYQFWTEVENVAILDTIPPNPPEPPDWAEKVASYGTDVSVGLACILTVPLTMGWSIAGLAASTTASLAMECAFDDVWNWINNVLGPPEQPDPNH